MITMLTWPARTSLSAGAAPRYGTGGRAQTGTRGGRDAGSPESAGSAAIHQAITAAQAAGIGPLTSHTGLTVRLPGSGDLVAYLADEDVDVRDAKSLADADDKPAQLLCVKNLRYSLKRRLGGDEGRSRRLARGRQPRSAAASARGRHVGTRGGSLAWTRRRRKGVAWGSPRSVGHSKTTVLTWSRAVARRRCARRRISLLPVRGAAGEPGAGASGGQAAVRLGFHRRADRHDDRRDPDRVRVGRLAQPDPWDRRGGERRIRRRPAGGRRVRGLADRIRPVVAHVLGASLAAQRGPLRTRIRRLLDEMEGSEK